MAASAHDGRIAAGREGAAALSLLREFRAACRRWRSRRPRLCRRVGSCSTLIVRSGFMDRLNQVLLNKNIEVGADLGAWVESGGGKGLAKALSDPDAVIKTIERADLRGMGGAG